MPSTLDPLPGMILLETLPMPSVASTGKVYPPGAELDDPLHVDEPPIEERPEPPRIRIVTVETPTPEPEPVASMRKLDPNDSGGHDPTRPIGRGNPPRHSQQQPGAPSRNPKGRPPGTSNPDALTRFMNQKIEVELPGGKRSITRREHLLRLIVDQAVAGNRHMRKLVQEYEQAEQVLADLQLAHDLKVAAAGEQPQLPLKQKFNMKLSDSYQEKYGVLRRLEAKHILVRCEDGYEIADWMRAAIAKRRAAE